MAKWEQGVRSSRHSFILGRRREHPFLSSSRTGQIAVCHGTRNAAAKGEEKSNACALPQVCSLPSVPARRIAPIAVRIAQTEGAAACRREYGHNARRAPAESAVGAIQGRCIRCCAAMVAGAVPLRAPAPLRAPVPRGRCSAVRAVRVRSVGVCWRVSGDAYHSERSSWALRSVGEEAGDRARDARPRGDSDSGTEMVGTGGGSSR